MVEAIGAVLLAWVNAEAFIYRNDLSNCLGFLISFVNKKTIYSTYCRRICFADYICICLWEKRIVSFHLTSGMLNIISSSNRPWVCPHLHGHSGESNHKESYYKFTLDFVDVDFMI